MKRNGTQMIHTVVFGQLDFIQLLTNISHCEVDGF